MSYKFIFSDNLQNNVEDPDYRRRDCVITGHNNKVGFQIVSKILSTALSTSVDELNKLAHSSVKDDDSLTKVCRIYIIGN